MGEQGREDRRRISLQSPLCWWHIPMHRNTTRTTTDATRTITIIIQDKDTNPKSFLVILREPENVLHFIYHYCLEACQLVLLIKSTPIVLMASQIILNSTCWPAMKIAVKLETATYVLMLKLASLYSALLRIHNIYIYIMYCIPSILFHIT